MENSCKTYNSYLKYVKVFKIFYINLVFLSVTSRSVTVASFAPTLVHLLDI